MHQDPQCQPSASKPLLNGMCAMKRSSICLEKPRRCMVEILLYFTHPMRTLWPYRLGLPRAELKLHSSMVLWNCSRFTASIAP